MKYYFSYRPIVQNTFSVCFLNQFLDINKGKYSDIVYTEVVSNGDRHFGFVESDNSEQMANLWKTISGEFSADRLTEDEFIGACYMYYIPVKEYNDESELSFTDFMKRFGIYITEEKAIDCLRSYKRYLFKELVRKRFEDYNDIAADMFKIMFFMFYYYDTLNESEKSWFDSIMSRLSSFYTKSKCMAAIESMISYIERYLVTYYYKVEELNSKSTKDEIVSVEMSV